jgi:hypothetical protein
MRSVMLAVQTTTDRRLLLSRVPGAATQKRRAPSWQAGKQQYRRAADGGEPRDVG